MVGKSLYRVFVHLLHIGPWVQFPALQNTNLLLSSPSTVCPSSHSYCTCESPTNESWYSWWRITAWGILGGSPHVGILPVNISMFVINRRAQAAQMIGYLEQLMRIQRFYSLETLIFRWSLLVLQLVYKIWLTYSHRSAKRTIFHSHIWLWHVGLWVHILGHMWSWFCVAPHTNHWSFLCILHWVSLVASMTFHLRGEKKQNTCLLWWQSLKYFRRMALFAWTISPRIYYSNTYFKRLAVTGK